MKLHGYHHTKFALTILLVAQTIFVLGVVVTLLPFSMFSVEVAGAGLLPGGAELGTPDKLQP